MHCAEAYLRLGKVSATEMATLLTVLEHILGVMLTVSVGGPDVAHFINVRTGIATSFFRACLVNEIDLVPSKRRLRETANAVDPCSGSDEQA
jgi:NAD/NADP transhydrogenase beta subunit